MISSASAFRRVCVADTARFLDFGPYVPSIDATGRIAFTATLASGQIGVFRVQTNLETVSLAGVGTAAEIRDFYSHPALTDEGGLSVYATLTEGRQALILVDSAGLSVIASTGDELTRIGPLGPTINSSGAVAFRGDTRAGGPGVFMAAGGAIVPIADTRAFSAFFGLPVIDNRGTVVFRTDQGEGRRGIMASRAGQLIPLLPSSERFAELGAFPSLNQHGAVAFAAREVDGHAGVFTVDNGKVSRIVDQSAGFAGFRGALINDAGQVFFYATRSGKDLGVYAAHAPEHAIVALGEPLFGSTVVDLALNPVSINACGQLAIRVKLADARQLILRVDPS